MHTKWYLAGLIQEFHAINKDTKLVYINWTLVNARDAEDAYIKSLEFGEEYNMEYTNNEGITVTVRFKGLRDLNEIYDELKDGSEIVYDEFVGINNLDIDRMITSKENLSAFRPRKTIDI